MQVVLFDMPLNEEDARKIAYNVIRSELGSIPYPGKPKLKDGIWIVPILVRYPRILFSEGDVPEKVRFMNFENVGEIKIDANKGELLYRPRYYEVSNIIKENLEKVRITVEMALVKVGANRFAQLPFPAHIHSPIVDILSWLLINDKIDMAKDLSLIGVDDKDKYVQNINLLESTGLIRKSENLILPDNNLIEIETRYQTLPEKLSSSLAFFFEKGYTFIDSIKQVLGPHLTITGFCYEKSLEYGDLIPISYETIDRIVADVYRQEVKRIKLPRYLIQLETVGLLEEKIKHGKVVWSGTEEIFRKIQGEEEILQPVRRFFA
ncbi:MAG: hypothetical protein Q8O41_08735 [Candidatus Methanoperedens sp.]|nr:hypothetical protein [Candidatus Methanoperedens sp.]